MQRYFVAKKEPKIVLSKEDSYHITKVMRMKIGDLVEVVIEDILYLSKVTNIKELVQVEIVEEIKENNELDYIVTLAQGLVKELKMDFILQKNTELGISSFIPVELERSVVKINKKDHKKITRWQKIVKEAAEQAKRTKIPIVNEVCSLEDLLKASEFDIKILCSTSENTKQLKKVLSKVKKGATILMIVGPEGGFTEKEEKRLIENGFIKTSLGNSILRTETASMFLLSVIRFINMG